MNGRRHGVIKKGIFVAALALAVAVVGTAVAAFPEDSVRLYTGCLNSGGTINYVKEGDAPLQACASPKQVVKLSGGDITSVNTPAGSGLSGGSTNGAVTLTLDAAHSLPTGCSSGQVAKSTGSNAWNCGSDNDHTYAADGTTLDLSSGGTFSIDPDYRVKNTSDCPSGQFARGFDSSGSIQCGAPTAPSLQSFQARQTNYVAGDGIPDDGEFRTYVTLPVPSGTYLVVGKGRIHQGDDDEGFTTVPGVSCRIGNLPDESFNSQGKDNEPDDYGFALTGVVATSGSPITLECSALDDIDLVDLRNGTLVALKVG